MAKKKINYPEYIHLYLSDVKSSIDEKGNFVKPMVMSQLNTQGSFRNKFNRNTNEATKKLESYLTSKVNPEGFEAQVRKSMENVSYSNPSLEGVSGISPAVSLEEYSKPQLASTVEKIRTNAVLMKKVISQYGVIIDKMEKIDDTLVSQIENLCLENPNIKEALELTIPDGAYRANSTTEQVVQKSLSSLKSDIDILEKLLNEITSSGLKGEQLTSAMRQQTTKRKSEDVTLSKLMQCIETTVSTTRGFMYETEVLKAFLQASVAGHGELLAVPTGGGVGKGSVDKQIAVDRNEYKSLLEKLESSIASIQVSNPKADITCGFNNNGDFLVFGLSIKSVSKSRFQAIFNGKGGKDVSISLGSVANRSVYDIMKNNKSAIGSAIGVDDPLWYIKQLLAGIPGDYTDEEKAAQLKSDTLKVDVSASVKGSYTRAWNNILNLCSILTLTDALIGISAKTEETGGYATYFVVNNKVFRAMDIIAQVKKNLRTGESTGIYGGLVTLKGTNTLNKQEGLRIQLANFQRAKDKTSVRSAALERSNAVSSEFDERLRVMHLKTSISLGALVNLANSKQGLTAIN
jgi:hypothetical protein